MSLWAAGAACGQTIIIDNHDAGFILQSGTWNTGAFGSPYGADYRWTLTTGASGAPAGVEWRPVLPEAGEYEVAVHHVSGANRAMDAPFTIHHAGGSAVVLVDQQTNDSTWVPLGAYVFEAGTSGYAALTNSAEPTVVIADAVRFRQTDGLVPYDDPQIRIGGALFAQAEDHALRLDRIDPVLLADPGGMFSPTVAVLTTGVTVRFRTESATVRANFNDISYVVTQGTGYVVFQDGVFDRLVSDLEIVDITSWQPGMPVTYEIVCPSYGEVTFAGVELDGGASLSPLPLDQRPRYFALGDSITHGSQLDAETKADSTTSYPWVLAAGRGWELYNLAVGGSKVAPEFGTMLRGQQADIITVLWGLNDKSHDNDLGLFTSKYQSLLFNLRTAQPRAPIYCITPITSSNEGPGANGYTLDDYRDAIAAIVTARRAAGDCHLHLVRGEELTTLADLSDGTHLSVAGAAGFATGLAGAIEPLWGDFNNDGSCDEEDGLMLVECLGGPGVSPQPGMCAGIDLDCDDDVDLREFAAYQQRCSP